MTRLCDFDICDSCVHRRIYVLSKCLLPMTPYDTNNREACDAGQAPCTAGFPNNQLNNSVLGPKFCNLELDIYPIVPPDPPQNNLQVVSTDGCYLNHSFNSNQESDVFDFSNRSSCVLQNPDNASLGIPVTSNFQPPPYFYSTYV